MKPNSNDWSPRTLLSVSVVPISQNDHCWTAHCVSAVYNRKMFIIYAKLDGGKFFIGQVMGGGRVNPHHALLNRSLGSAELKDDRTLDDGQPPGTHGAQKHDCRVYTEKLTVRPLQVAVSLRHVPTPWQHSHSLLKPTFNATNQTIVDSLTFK